MKFPASSPYEDPFVDEETRTQCPSCIPSNPRSPTSYGFGYCTLCLGTNTVTREYGTKYRTEKCPVCLNGRCRLCSGTGLVRASVAAQFRRT